MSASPLFTCSDMARTLRRNTTSIWRAIKRLKIQPVSIISNGTVKLYNSAALDLIRAEIRTPNRTK